MSNYEILMMLVVLVLGTQICRFLPEFLPKKVLSSPILQKLNQILPLVIMLLLVLTSLSFPHTGGEFPLFISQLIALIVVVISYRGFKNTLLSVALGIASLNGILWVIN